MVLPAYDEEATVADVVRRAPAFVRGHPVEVLVVDDGSTDATAAAARAGGATVHSLPRNRGLGAAVRTGLAWAVEQGAAAVAFLDADGEYAPEEMATLLAPILDDRADYVIGSRFAGLPRDMRPHRWFGNRVLTVGMKLLVRRWGVRGLTDGQSGYRALSAAAAADAEIVHDFNYAQVLTLDLIAKGYRYAEVPISYRFRRHGRSFVRLGPYLRKVVPAVWCELRAPASALEAERPVAPVAPTGSRTADAVSA
jgi:glycosyltransferase involved in cell wall biosynthesis